MDADHKKILKAVVLEMRHELEGYYDNAGKWHPGDLETRLAEIGVRKDRASVPVDELGRLIEEDVRARKIVDAFIDVREQAGVDRAEAVAEYIRESAYTWANRLVALRCMEARELLDDEVIVGREAYGGRSLVHHRLVQASPELCTGEDDGRFAMLAQVFAERAKTLPMLFDPDAPSIALRPSPAALKNCLAWLSGAQKVRSQEHATDAVFATPDALGWAYQYWNTEEKDRVFETVRTKKGAKIEGADIIPATQLYTEDYMVKFLVQNSLGATWMSMHPESKLFEAWEYYVRDADRAPIKIRSLQQITLFDPACGSGHFLIEAFDLLYSMYEEDGTLKDPEAICRSILENNLFGIDIDERAIQIAEAALWMKAEDKTFGFSGAKTNLVAATSSHLQGESWERFLKTFEQEPHIPRVLREFARSIRHIDELGSLARPYEALEEIIKIEHELWEKQERERLEHSNYLFQELREDLLATQLPFQDISDKEFFDRTMQRALTAIDGFTKEARASGEFNDQLIGAEARSGFRLLDLLSRRYSIVLLNPPYMSKRTQGPQLSEYLKTHYSIAATDLYTTFMYRSWQLCDVGGIAAMVTMNTYLTISSYSELRKHFLTESTIRLCWDLGPFAFQDLTDHVKAAMLVFQKVVPIDTAVITFAGLTRIKRKSPVLADASYQFRKHQNSLAKLPDAPWAYELSDNLIEKFANLEPLASYFSTPSPSQTGRDDRFVRVWWECSASPLGSDESRWVTYTMGGLYEKWRRRVPFKIDWSAGARIHYRSNPLSRITGEHDWYKKGITYTALCTTTFNARLLQGDAVYDRTGPALFPACEDSTHWILGFLNSKAAAFLLKKLNHTLSYQAGDLRKLFAPQFTQAQEEALSTFSKTCVDAKHAIDRLFLQCPYFSGYQLVGGSFFEFAKTTINRVVDCYIQILECENSIEDVVAQALDLKPSETAMIRQSEGNHPAGNDGLELELEDTLSVLRDSHCELLKGVSGHWCRSSIELMSAKNNLNPRAIGTLFPQQLSKSDKAVLEWVENFVSFKCLDAMGFSWESTVSHSGNNEGLAPLTKCEHHESLHDRILHEIRSSSESVIEESINGEFQAITGLSLEKWIAVRFFEHHLQVFGKRPVVWQLNSSTFTTRRSPVFSCFIRSTSVDDDTIAKIRSQYVRPLLRRLETEHRGILATPINERSDRQSKRSVELEESISALQSFDNRLERVLSNGFCNEKLQPVLRQYAFDDAMLSMKACFLHRLSILLEQSPGEEATNGVRKASLLDHWREQAIASELHQDLAGWICEALSHLRYFCSQVGPKAPDAKKTPEDPTAAALADLIEVHSATMQTRSMKLACGVWWGKVDAAVLAPLRERLKILKAEQTELNAAIKEDRQPALVVERSNSDGSEDISSESEPSVTDIPLLRNHVFEPTIELTKSAMKVRLKEVKAKIKKFTEEMKSKTGKAQAIRDAIQAWRLPDPIPVPLDFSRSSPNLPPLFDQVSSLDERRSPPKTIADFIAQESLYAPDINDGVRVNIAPLQKAGILAADVLAAKDVDKAIADRAEWRADERRWVREGKLPQPGWWKASKEDEPRNALNE